ncbi:hypothetical protein JTB14_005537 [Gonioctena quinquepunctata]|nr:hypothetical protein JTB14_005537 [Gonioctena quinquepunctata]
MNYHLWTKKMSEVTIGIDLGTTFSCAAVYKRGKCEVIPDQNGDRLIPSMVYFDPDTGEVHVGKNADKLSPRCPRNCLKDSKRILGRKIDDEYISRYRRQKDIQFSLERGENDNAVFQLIVQDQLVTKAPEEVSSEILKYLKKMADAYLGKEVKEAVISIPAYFSNAQRKATKKAAEIAGLKLSKFITEPSAGALHYLLDKNTDSKLLVFDWGGGTLDVSLIQVRNKIFEVKSVYGDTLLGGRDFDKKLFDHFYKPVDEKFNRRLQHKCEDLKRQLSTLNNFTVTIECYDGANDLELQLTSREFEKLNEELFQRAIDIVEYGLSDAGWKKSDVNEVVLVGGSTRIPKIRSLLQNLFGKSKLKTDLNPDEAVAIGACLQAAMLKTKFANAEQYKITEVTPLSLGVETSDHLMSTIIMRNTSLPAESTKTFITRDNDQREVSFNLIEGERKNTTFNNELGKLSLTGLPCKRAGDVEMSVTFHLDEDGILTVTATETSTGNTNQLRVTLGEFRLSEHKIKLSVQQAAINKYEDDTFEAFILDRDRMTRKCKHILYDLSKITSESYKIAVREKCQHFLNYAAKLKFTESVELEKNFKSLYEFVTPILNEYGLQELTGCEVESSGCLEKIK